MTSQDHPSSKQMKRSTLSHTLAKLVDCYPQATVINLTKYKLELPLPPDLLWLDVNSKGKPKMANTQALIGNLANLSWLEQLDKTTNQKLIVLVSENKKYSCEQLNQLLDKLSGWAPCIDLLIDKKINNSPALWPINGLHQSIELIDVMDIELAKVPKSWLKRLKHWFGARTHYQVYHYGSIDF